MLFVFTLILVKNKTLADQLWNTVFFSTFLCISFGAPVLYFTPKGEEWSSSGSWQNAGWTAMELGVYGSYTVLYLNSTFWVIFWSTGDFWDKIISACSLAGVLTKLPVSLTWRAPRSFFWQPVMIWIPRVLRAWQLQWDLYLWSARHEKQGQTLTAPEELSHSIRALNPRNFDVFNCLFTSRSLPFRWVWDLTSFRVKPHWVHGSLRSRNPDWHGLETLSSTFRR